MTGYRLGQMASVVFLLNVLAMLALGVLLGRLGAWAMWGHGRLKR